MKIKAVVKAIPKPQKPQAPEPPKPVIRAIKAKVKGPDWDEVMRWRRGQITCPDGTKIMGYRKKVLGVPEYKVRGKEFPATQVQSFRRDEWICQPHQSSDPQA